MRRAGVTLAILGMAATGALLPASAPAAIRHWQFSAQLTGSYDNAVTANARCNANYAERVTGLRVVASAKLDYDPRVHVLSGPLRLRVLGGRWTLGGAYLADASAADGTPACASSTTPIDCKAAILADDGQTVGTSMTVRLLAETPRKGQVTARIDAPHIAEQYADVGKPPANWPSVCRASTDDRSVVVSPLFGFASTDLPQQVLGSTFAVPVSKLTGRHAFSVKGPTPGTGACPAQGFDPCTEHVALALRVSFTPKRR